MGPRTHIASVLHRKLPCEKFWVGTLDNLDLSHSPDTNKLCDWARHFTCHFDVSQDTLHPFWPLKCQHQAPNSSRPVSHLLILSCEVR